MGTLAMMKLLTLLCVICIKGGFAQVTVTMTCTPTSYTFVISGTTQNGQAFIRDLCDPKATTAQSTTLTFVDSDCGSNSIPALDTSFTFVVQKNSAVESNGDTVLTCTCDKDLNPVVQVTGGVSVTPGATGDTVTSSLAPTFTLSLEDGSGGALTSGVVGTTAALKVTMDAAYRNDFGHQINKIVANGVTIISSGCSNFDDIADANGASSDGVVTWNFALFMIYTSVSGSAATITYTVTIGVCDVTCTTQSCGTRKKREELLNVTTILNTSVVVYPKGSFNNLENKGDKQVEEGTVCVSRTPFTVALIGLAIGMVVCLTITVCMFVKMRKSSRHNKADSIYARKNHGYKR